MKRILGAIFAALIAMAGYVGGVAAAPMVELTTFNCDGTGTLTASGFTQGSGQEFDFTVRAIDANTHDLIQYQYLSITDNGTISFSFPDFNGNGKIRVFLRDTWDTNFGREIVKDCIDNQPAPTGTLALTVKTQDGSALWPSTSICVNEDCVYAFDIMQPGSSSVTYTFGPYAVGTYPVEVYNSLDFESYEGSITIPDGGTSTTVTLIRSDSVPPPTSNDFTPVTASRTCADQSFTAIWNGRNLKTVEFAFSNTSDGWVSDWMSADPTSSVFHTIPTHAYDRAKVRVTFTNGETTQRDTAVNACNSTPTPPLETVTPTTAPTEVPVVNSFMLTGAARACTDQSFSASWTGGNLKTVEFSLSNTSDNWTSGWLTADAASGWFSSPVDHHKYDKVMARATFIDGATQQQDADVGTCSDTPVPPPVPTQPPVPPTQAPSQPTTGSSQQPAVVTSLPVTGSGVAHTNALMIMLALVGTVIVGAMGIARISTRKRSAN